MGNATPKRSLFRTTIYRKTSYCPVPDNSGNATRDSGEWYGWAPPASTATARQAWITAYRALTPEQQGATRLILDDGVQVALPVADAPDVTIDAVASVREDATQQLQARISGGTYDALAYAWSDSGAGGAFSDAAIANPVYTPPDVARNTEVMVTCEVTATGTGTVARDGTSDTARDDEAFTVTFVMPSPVLRPPVFAQPVGNEVSAIVGTAIAAVVVPAATGNPAPVYAVVGNLPAGITFDARTRTIEGTPEAVGSGTIRIRATNSQGMADWTAPYDFEQAADAPAFAQARGAFLAALDSPLMIVAPLATGVPAPVYSLVGDLPAGLMFDPATRTISGRPAALGSGQVTIRATNSAGSADWIASYEILSSLPAFALANVPAPVTECNETQRFHAGGDYRQVASGKVADGSRGFLRVWSVTTDWISGDRLTALRAVLDQRRPQDIGGTLIGPVRALPRFRGADKRTELHEGQLIVVAERLRLDLLETG